MDGIGDVCDLFPNDPDNDIDGDGVSGEIDNCPVTPNADQLDVDVDGIGDVCDLFPNDPDNDGDGIGDNLDNCPNILNPNQNDLDSDGIGDVCDAETIIHVNTVLTTDTSLGGDLIVDGANLTINSGATMDIDLVNFDWIIKSGGSVLIKAGGQIT